MNTLSPRQQAIYRFIQDYLFVHGLPPTNREIGEAVGIASTGHVDYHLDQLEKKGYIERVEHAARGIRLVQAGVEVKGRIAAGQPLEIFDAPEHLLDLTSQATSGRRYLLGVRGTSMIEDHIADGDYVLIDPDAAIALGDIIVAYGRGEAASERGAATLKRFYKERNRIELRPANAALTSRFIEAQEWERDWAIQGKVRAIYRIFERP
jgi:repressor LexA